MSDERYQIARFMEDMETTRYPIMMTATEMKVIGGMLLSAHEGLSECVEAMREDEHLDVMSDEEKARLKFMNFHAKFLQHMGSKLTYFAHDIKEKSEAKYNINIDKIDTNY